MQRMIESVSVLHNGRMIQFERRLGVPVQEAWDAITDPQKLATWLAKLNTPLTQGGKFDLEFENTGFVLHCTVTQLQPQKLLEYTIDSQDDPAQLPALAAKADGGGTCGGSLRADRLSFALDPIGTGTMLTFRHAFAAPPQSQGAAPANALPASADTLDVMLASWHNHFDMLDHSLASKSAVAGITTAQATLPADWQWDRWQELQAKYARSLS